MSLVASFAEGTLQLAVQRSQRVASRAGLVESLARVLREQEVALQVLVSDKAVPPDGWLENSTA